MSVSKKSVFLSSTIVSWRAKIPRKTKTQRTDTPSKTKREKLLCYLRHPNLNHKRNTVYCTSAVSLPIYVVVLVAMTRLNLLFTKYFYTRIM